MKKRNSPVKVSSGAGLNPYQKSDFVFESRKKDNSKNLGRIMSDKEFEIFVEKVTKSRTFLIKPDLHIELCDKGYEKDHKTLVIKKQELLEIVKDLWKPETIKRLKEIKKEKLTIQHAYQFYWTVTSNLIKPMNRPFN